MSTRKETSFYIDHGHTKIKSDFSLFSELFEKIIQP